MTSSPFPADAGVPTDLLDAAVRVRAHAYVPYSHFAVGAALRTADGAIHAGANVENASFGLSRCAEQSAVQAMVSAGGRRIAELVVVADADPPASPCGACRQVLREFGDDAPVHLVNAAGRVTHTTVAALLPGAFALAPDGA